MQRLPHLGSLHDAARLVLAGLLVWSALIPAEVGAQPSPTEPRAPNPAEWMNLEQALEQAQASARPVFVYVHASWCAPCHRLERDVFPHLEAELKGVVTASVDLSEPRDPGFRDASRAWIRANGLDTPPAFALLTIDGEVVASMTGFQSASQLRHLLSLGNDLAVGR